MGPWYSALPRHEERGVALNHLGQPSSEGAVCGSQGLVDLSGFSLVATTLVAVPVLRRRLEVDDAVGKLDNPNFLRAGRDAGETALELGRLWEPIVLGECGYSVRHLSAECGRHLVEGCHRVLQNVVEQRAGNGEIGILYRLDGDAPHHLRCYRAQVDEVWQPRAWNKLRSVPFG